MNRDERDEPQLSAEDRRLIETIDATFRPAAMSPTRRVQFRARLDERIARRTCTWPWLAPLIASAAVISLWLAQPSVAPVAETSLTGSELFAFLEPDSAADSVRESGIYLPDDYQALATLYEGDETGR